MSVLRAQGAEEYAFPLETTVAKALEKAKANQRLVFVEFMVRGCRHCELFREKVLQSESFATYAREHLHVVIYHVGPQQDTPDQSAELKTLMMTHQVQYTPTIVILSADGRRLLRSEGYQGTPPDDILAELKQLSNIPKP